MGMQTRTIPQDGAFGAFIRYTLSTSGLSTSSSYSVRGAPWTLLFTAVYSTSSSCFIEKLKFYITTS